MLNRVSRTASLDPAESSEDRFDLHGLLHFLWRQWRFIAIIVALAVVVGTVQLIRATPIYTAHVQVLLDPRKPKALGEDAIFTDAMLTAAAVESDAAVLRSTSLLRRVVEREKLVPPEDVAEAKANEAKRLEANTSGGSSFSGVLNYIPGFRRNLQANVVSYPARVNAAIDSLRGAIEVTRLSQTYILSISFSATDPVRAARMANAIADAYIIDKLDTRFEAAQRASAWLSDRLAELRKQIRDSEAAVTQFRVEHHLLQGTANLTLNQQQLNELNGKLVAARTEVAEKKARLDLLNSVESKGGNLQSLLPDLVRDNATVGGLRSQLAALTQKEADLLGRYGDRHPLVINVRAERRDLESHIASEIKKLGANVRNDYEIAKAKADSLEASLREVTGQGNLDSAAMATLRELERAATVNKTMFEDFLQRSKVTQEQATFEVKDARIITPAQPPGAPSSPRKFRVMVISIALGLVFGVMAAVGREMLNAGFVTPKQVEDQLGIPVLTSVSRVDTADLQINGQAVTIPQYVAQKPLSRYSESIRALRSGIQMTDVDNPPKVVQVTSSVPSEGKTTMAMSLATSAASAGAKVLYIDADLRRPSGTQILTGAREEGLVELLVGTATVQSAIKYLPDAKIWVLGAGAKTQNPSDLLSSERMKTLLGTFRQNFDFIVVDTPPSGPVVDPLVVAQIVDKVIFVVRWASTARELVERIVHQFSMHNNIAGIVLNHVIDKEAQKYGKYAYSYYYGARQYKNYYQA